MSESQQISSDEEQMELENEQKQLKEYLKQVPFQVLLKQQKTIQADQKRQQGSKDKKQKRALIKGDHDRKTPVERSAKTPVSRLVKVFEPKKKAATDPRFASFAGKLDPQRAQQSFSFLTQVQEREKEVLKKAISNKKLAPEQKQQLVMRYNQVTDSLKANEMRKTETEILRQNKKNLREQQAKGQTPFYKTKQILKSEVSQARFNRLDTKHQNKAIQDNKKRIQQRLGFKKRDYIRESKQSIS